MVVLLGTMSNILLRFSRLFPFTVFAVFLSVLQCSSEGLPSDPLCFTKGNRKVAIFFSPHSMWMGKLSTN